MTLNLPPHPSLDDDLAEAAFGGGARAKKRRFPLESFEHYVEEPFVSAAPFAACDFGPVVVDPCAGFGHVVHSARRAGLKAYGCDIVARAPGMAGGRDFLEASCRAPRRAGREFALVFNPPYGGRTPLIRRFAEAAVARADSVAMLIPVPRLRLAGAWLEALPHAETLILDKRTSLWPGRIYAAKVAAGDKLGVGFDDVCWLRRAG